MAETISIPSAAEAMRIAVAKSARKSKTISIPAGQKVAVVVLPLNSGVTSADYPALKAAIEAITRIQNGVNLVVDGISRASVEAGYEQLLHVAVQLMTREIPTPP